MLGDGTQALHSSQACRVSLPMTQPSGSLREAGGTGRDPLPSPHSPGSLLTSHVSCFFEILVQLRSRLTGCLLMMPLSAWGVMDLHLLKSIFVHNLLSQHLGTRTWLKIESQEFHGITDNQQVARQGSPALECPSHRTRLFLLVSIGFPKHGRLLKVSPSATPPGFCCHKIKLQVAAAGLPAPAGCFS